MKKMKVILQIKILSIRALWRSSEENSLETGVRLKASVLYQLFEDTNYKLSDVRINKVAKPVEIGKLPYELKEIQSVKKRKELFIQIVLPYSRRK